MSNRFITILAVIAAIVVVLSVATFRNNQYKIEEYKRMEAFMMSMGNDYKKSSSDTLNSDSYSNKSDHGYAKGIVNPAPGQPIKKFRLTAREVQIEIAEGLTIPVWTYNGTVPGQEIRVKQGDFVQVELRNDLKVPITIHWHGYPLKSAMDGVPGLNQDAIKPGETFTYEFSADVEGTYWYHSHQEGAKQVDKGLYGALIVEPNDASLPDRDYTLILDEWMSVSMEEDMGSMDMSSYTLDDLIQIEEDMMASSYDIYTVNAKSGKLIQPLEAKVGETIRLRFINAGYRSHGIHVPGQDIKIVSTDGQEINGAGIIRDQIVMIAPGERYDIEFKINSKDNFIIDAHDENGYNNQLRIPFNIIDGSGAVSVEEFGTEYTEFDLTSYGIKTKGQLALQQVYDVIYEVELGIASAESLKYTINGKVYKELPALKVKTGDKVKISYFNNSKVNHPMHLHGHFFQVLSRNSIALSGALVTKDTLMIKPGEKYEVAFIADNTGNWVQHCHELHHAAGGMMQAIEYTDFESNYEADPKATYNIPE
ncbi:MAG: multicopper oxidase family protein [Bacillota bacterium]